MAKRRPSQIITIIGTQFFQPIADLSSKLVSRQYQLPDRVGSNYYECGYSAAIILLLAASIESVVQRDRYFYLKTIPTSKPSDIVRIYSKEILHYRRHMHLQEVFDVRNSIAHNHVWEVDFQIPRAGGRRHKKSRIVSFSHRLGKNIPQPNARIPRTRRLKLNLQPTRLDRTDVIKVMSANLHFLFHLSVRGNNPINFSDDIVIFRNKKSNRIPFSELISVIRDSL